MLTNPSLMNNKSDPHWCVCVFNPCSKICDDTLVQAHPTHGAFASTAYLEPL